MGLYLPLCPSCTFIYHCVPHGPISTTVSLMDPYLPLCPSWTCIYHCVPHGPISTTVFLVDLYLPQCPSWTYIYHSVPHGPISTTVSLTHCPAQCPHSTATKGMLTASSVWLFALHSASVAAATLNPIRNQISPVHSFLSRYLTAVYQ